MNTGEKILIGSLVGMSMIGGAVFTKAVYEVGKELIKGKPTLEATVVREFGTLEEGLVNSSGAMFGNRSVKIGEGTYGVVLQEGEANYTFGVRENYEGLPVYVWAGAIEQGDRLKIEFPRYRGLPRNGTVGVIGTSQIIGHTKAEKK